jgi:nucleotide-binding universal stress UspA family protein
MKTLQLPRVDETLAALADELGCDHIIMGTRGLGAISSIVLGSVTRKVLHLANVPVTCVKSESPRR